MLLCDAFVIMVGMLCTYITVLVPISNTLLVCTIPPSFVKAMISLASPTPALVEALTEMTYGTYGSEIRGKIIIFMDVIPIKSYQCIHSTSTFYGECNIPMSEVVLMSRSSLCTSNPSTLVFVSKLMTLALYPVMTPLGDRGGSQDTWNPSDTTTTCTPTTMLGAVTKFQTVMYILVTMLLIPRLT